MRIFFIGSYKTQPTTGGHVYNRKAIDAMREMGNEVVTINIHQLPAFFKWRFLSFLFCFIKFAQKSPALIIQVADTASRYFGFSFFTYLKGIPTIQIVHHFEEELHAASFKRNVNKSLIIRNLKKAKYIITNSDNTRDKVISYIGPRYRNIIAVINPGVDINRQSAEVKNYHKKTHWNIISVGAITRRKGYDYLIDALKRLTVFPFKCRIVGGIEDKDLYALLDEKIKYSHLEDKIEFTGYISNEMLRELYQASDLFVLPSMHEGYGIALCEALCHGIPIIATATGAIPELLQNNKNAVLVKPGDSGALARALESLFTHPEFTAKLSKEALEKCKIFNSWDAMKLQVKNIIKRLPNG